MKALSKNSNDLQSIVENNRRKTHKNQSVDAESLNFPKLSEDFGDQEFNIWRLSIETINVLYTRASQR